MIKHAFNGLKKENFSRLKCVFLAETEIAWRCMSAEKQYNAAFDKNYSYKTKKSSNFIMFNFELITNVNFRSAYHSLKSLTSSLARKRYLSNFIQRRKT